MEFIKNPGGCVVSNNIINKKGVLKWCVRERSVNEVDNGWRFFADIDTDEILSDSSNLSIWDFNTVAEIEPAVLAIYNMPIGSDITLINEAGKKFLVYTETGERIDRVSLMEK